MSHSSTLVLFDEATTLACVNGSVTADQCGVSDEGRKISDTTTVHSAMGTNTAARAGLLRVHKCQWPPGYEGRDGVCAASFPNAANRASS